MNRRQLVRSIACLPAMAGTSSLAAAAVGSTEASKPSEDVTIPRDLFNEAMDLIKAQDSRITELLKEVERLLSRVKVTDHVLAELSNHIGSSDGRKRAFHEGLSEKDMAAFRKATLEMVQHMNSERQHGAVWVG